MAMGDQTIHFSREATRWQGIWLDSTLTLVKDRRRQTSKTRQAEARLRRVVSTYGVSLPAARNLQMATAQGTILYASEPTWSGGVGAEGECQRAINRMGRAILGVSRSTPLGVITAENGHTPARALLNHRQARFAQRLRARPRDREGPEILTREGAALTPRRRAAAPLRPGGTV